MEELEQEPAPIQYVGAVCGSFICYLMIRAPISYPFLGPIGVKSSGFNLSIAFIWETESGMELETKDFHLLVQSSRCLQDARAGPGRGTKHQTLNPGLPQGWQALSDSPPSPPASRCVDCQKARVRSQGTNQALWLGMWRSQLAYWPLTHHSHS